MTASLQISRSLLGTLAVLKNVVVWMVSTGHPTSKSSSPFNNPLVTVLKATIIFVIIVTFMFNSFLQFPSKRRGTNPSFNFLQFYFVVSRDSKVQNFASSLCLLIIIRSGFLAVIRGYVCMSKFKRSLCVSFSRTDAELCIYHMFVRSNFNFLYISQWITLPTQSCQVLYFFCANLLHSLIMWLMVSSLSPHNLHLLFCCVLSLLTLI